MSDARNDKRSRRAWELAGRQHGIVTRQQLLGLGFGPRSIEHRIAHGRLHLVMHGVYAVGWPTLTPRRRWMAAVLACGDEAMLSHRSAATLWGIAKEQADRVDVSVRRRCELKRPGLKVRSRAMLRPEDVAIKDRIPVTSVARTLVDLAAELDPIAVERAVNEADKRDLTDPEALRIALDRYEGEPGAPRLRKLLDKRTFRLSDSDLEILFRPIAAAAGLPSPLSKQVVNGWEVDFYWPDLGLVVETDGLRYHRTAATQTRDARRDRAHRNDPVSLEKSSRWSSSWKRATADVRGQADQGRREPE
ncbi:MAG TPA: type IV toxin-antitoxin system AbiEi family antitoxin domain-containing protein [Solirubrobacterales bacterium]|nr:type IV toxin-antitoxin system AbiEi family antitoxin domain-containing protein [Solirubrobacterales bacterium]